jgi:lysozyme family protein
MASFEPAYRTYIQPNEGGYANIVGDKGGETYAGIARNYFPNWPGWTYIDFIKKTKGPIKNNAKFPDVQSQVDQFYHDWWNSKRLSEIKSQDVANLLFDYNVHSGALAIKAIQRLVNVPADGAMGSKTITAINASDPAKLHDALKAERKALLEKLSSKPGQEQFRNGWLTRLSKFPDLVTPTSLGILGGAIVIGLGIFFLRQKLISQG